MNQLVSRIFHNIKRNYKPLKLRVPFINKLQTCKLWQIAVSLRGKTLEDVQQLTAHPQVFYYLLVSETPNQVHCRFKTSTH